MYKIVNQCLSKYEKFLEVFAKICSGYVYFVFAFMLFEVTARYFFNRPTIWVQEISLYFFGAASVLTGAYLMKTNQHIRVDIIYNLYPKRIKLLVDCLVAFIVFIWGSLLVYYGLPYFMETIKINELSITALRAPLWPIRLTIPLAGTLLLGETIAIFIKSIGQLMGKEAE